MNSVWPKLMSPLVPEVPRGEREEGEAPERDQSGGRRGGRRDEGRRGGRRGGEASKEGREEGREEG